MEAVEGEFEDFSFKFEVGSDFYLSLLTLATSGRVADEVTRQRCGLKT